MCTRSTSKLVGESSSNPTTSNPKRRNRRRSKQPFILEESLVDMMADQRTMTELLRAPTEGATRHWLEKEPPRSILTWKDLVSKFINEFFPPSRMTNLQNEISNFQQRFNESFHKAWNRYKDILCAYPHHGFTELHQLYTFYNALNKAHQDSLNSTVGGNRLEIRTQDVLTSVENKPKVRNSRNKSIVSQVKSSDANSYSSSEIAKLTHAINQQTSACLTANGNTFLKFWDNIQGYVLVAAVNYNQGELKAITTRSGLVLDGPSIAMPPPFINLEEDGGAEETLTDSELAEPFLRTVHALIDIHREEMFLRDGDERLTLNIRHDTSSYSNQPHKESINMINIYDDSYEDYLEDLFATNHLSGNPTFSSHTDLTSLEVINPVSGSTTSSSPDHLLEEFADELALITFPPGINDLPFDIESDHREIEYFLNHDPTKEMDSILEDSVDEDNLADPNNDLFITILEMFTDEHTLDYSSPPLYDDFDDDLVELESDSVDVYNDLFDSKEHKIKESKLLIDELDLPRSSDFLPSPEYDSVLYKDFSEVNALPSTNNEDKVFNLGILIQENLFEVTNQVTPDKNIKKISISNASLILEDFNPTPPLYELPFHKEVPGSETLLSFSSENEEKVFKPEILTSKGVHTFLLLELSHRGPKAFKVIKVFESPMEIFPFSYEGDI
uniref:Reverse transcriptase domain-containing protein n=1 Tax=Tanacetum cinerariifolium TaxID=118510 RepID=A0A6L2JIL7_TANCI|nr:reverse transcriptase domain-containing protein [Tanacetum cinerariifolium]